MDLSHEQIDILKYLDQNFTITKAEAFNTFSVISDYSLQELEKLKYIASYPSEPDLYGLTQKGKAFIDNYTYDLKEKENEMKQLRKDASFSKVISILALIVSILSLINQILR